MTHSRRRSLFLSIPTLLLLAAAAVAADNPPAGQASYTVNAGDILAILVWKEEDLKQETLVRPDGHFTFPLAGDIQAEGRTVDEIRADLTAKLAKFIPDPTVTITALKLEGNRVYVIGKVNRPGEFPMGRAIDVMQALAMAGGTTPFATVDGIKVLRRNAGQQVAIPFRYSAVESGKNLDQNILLRAGDTVVVP
jgi:polysaccharide export outer membrane protein